MIYRVNSFSDREKVQDEVEASHFNRISNPRHCISQFQLNADVFRADEHRDGL